MSKAIETPEARSDRGRKLAEKMSLDDFGDLAYLRGVEAKLNPDELGEFRALFFGDNCRAVAGVRPAVDLALAEMRKKLMCRLGKPRWGAAI